MTYHPFPGRRRRHPDGNPRQKGRLSPLPAPKAVLYANTKRVFFSPSRLRAARVVNDRRAATSGGSPATVELLQFPSPPRREARTGALLGPWWLDAIRSRFRPPYAVVGKIRLDRTPMRIAPGDGSVPMVLSYWGGWRLDVRIERFESRSWPAGGCTADIPGPDVIFSHANRDRSRIRRIAPDGPLIASSGGRFIAVLPDVFPSQRKLWLFDVETARDLPPPAFDQATKVLDPSAGSLQPCALGFSDDERELMALCLPRTDLDWHHHGLPDVTQLEGFVSSHAILVARWGTDTGERLPDLTSHERLTETYRRQVECPDIVSRPLRERIARYDWPGVKSSREPGLINWLYWKIMRYRFRRAARRLERTLDAVKRRSTNERDDPGRD